MNSALIGYTGFVGGNLVQQHAFQAKFNSKNFLEMKGQSYDEVVCAGVSAVKWLANKEPERDLAGIVALQEVLATVRAKRFVLISTVDVYPRLDGLDEAFDCRSLPNHAYGSHRLGFEEFCREHFQECHIVRLPGLFGAGLRKNVIFDLINNNCLHMINADSSFQFYYLARLWSDIELILRNGLPLVNLSTEPIFVRDIIERFFPGAVVGQEAGPELHYDITTRHGSLWGSPGAYCYSRDVVLRDLGQFLADIITGQ